ncbi:hypothetical protein BASA50_003498 [Batrachochytrium salamandrivorans]|uniref:Uncharacterized protein n=1 Tax=Batrachochytrium salamandrivorans TaxID=1357716 RepID=A0ABQ8FHL4_9FUNG|nr:hypothetical protein BASA62_003845 [Batrachochytrium salamandrivorans]KAH6575293.1 hypothetical protein BASA60_005097 [Batrachochytrium salamandrivorans]KAH6598458.1 hypothetical protein BASA50_003498 [Batrachochytrium salamandrivorans]KAH6599139.1 hypothetical protein BASA61_002670 [Batrachochytrium salamandrivorans]KAH9251632.1 hypothetical protein BASA81_010473 [Batrachochytrium salamandrivorans]
MSLIESTVLALPLSSSCAFLDSVAPPSNARQCRVTSSSRSETTTSSVILQLVCNSLELLYTIPEPLRSPEIRIAIDALAAELQRPIASDADPKCEQASDTIRIGSIEGGVVTHSHTLARHNSIIPLVLCFDDTLEQSSPTHADDAHNLLLVATTPNIKPRNTLARTPDSPGLAFDLTPTTTLKRRSALYYKREPSTSSAKSPLTSNPMSAQSVLHRRALGSWSFDLSPNVSEFPAEMTSGDLLKVSPCHFVKNDSNLHESDSLSAFHVSPIDSGVNLYDRGFEPIDPKCIGLN